TEKPQWYRETRLPSDQEEALLERLESLEGDLRWTLERARAELEAKGYVDVDTGLLLDQYLHIAAARALTLKRRDGYSEEVCDCLQRAWLAAFYDEGWYRKAEEFEDYFFIEDFARSWLVVSRWSVSAMVLLELARVSRVSGATEEALERYVRAVQYIVGVSSALHEILGDGEDRLGQFLVPSYANPADWNSTWRQLFDPRWKRLEFKPQELADTALVAMDGLGKSHTPDYQRVAYYCRRLVELCPGWSDDVYAVSDSTGDSFPWGQFWRRMEGRAEERLTPDGLREYRQQLEMKDSESRLRSYFFRGSLWDDLDLRAQEHLVSAERTWFSAKGAAVESALLELQAAVESICRPVIWEPLRAITEADLEHLRFVARDDELARSGHSPTLRDYETALGLSAFKSLTRTFGLSDAERRFLLDELPYSLRRLRDSRNDATHSDSRRWTREQVSPLMDIFLGIGREGVLPRLVAIGHKVAPAKPKGPAKPMLW
ncbi:MAG: hypothetical protein ACYC7H_14755, partial [Chloroflexota bacterium]